MALTSTYVALQPMTVNSIRRNLRQAIRDLVLGRSATAIEYTVPLRNLY